MFAPGSAAPWALGTLPKLIRPAPAADQGKSLVVLNCKLSDVETSERRPSDRRRSNQASACQQSGQAHRNAKAC